MLRATRYLCDMLSVERFDGNCGSMYALRESLVERWGAALTRIAMDIAGGLVSGNDVFARPSITQLTVLSASKGKNCNCVRA